MLSFFPKPRKIWSAIKIAFMAVIFTGCMVNTHRPSEIFIMGGPAFGGVVENNQLLEINSPADIDAIIGATRLSANLGVHAQFNIQGHALETGLDYIGFDQTISYSYHENPLKGIHQIGFRQIRLPVTYNFHLINDHQEMPLLILKTGVSAGYTLDHSFQTRGAAPPYTFDTFDFGPAIGLSFQPLIIADRYRLGIFIDFYRGSRIFTDRYHQAEGMGGQSYIKFGLSLLPLQWQF